MTNPDPSDPTVWFTPTRVMMLPDGSTLIKPGKPVLRTTAAKTSELTGISLKNLRNLSECGLIRCARPTPFVTFYYPGEIEAFVKRTEDDPAFWDKVKRDAYIRSSRLRDSRRRRPEDAG